MSIKHVMNLEVKNYHKTLISIEVIMHSPVERFFYNETCDCVLLLVYLFYETLVNAFYFHKYSYTFELLKRD